MTHAIAIGSFCRGCVGLRADVRLFRGRWALCPVCRIAARRGNVLGVTELPPNVAEGMATVPPLRLVEPTHGRLIPTSPSLAELDKKTGGVK